jgi:hypothetical protein
MKYLCTPRCLPPPPIRKSIWWRWLIFLFLLLPVGLVLMAVISWLLPDNTFVRYSCASADWIIDFLAQ